MTLFKRWAAGRKVGASVVWYVGDAKWSSHRGDALPLGRDLAKVLVLAHGAFLEYSPILDKPAPAWLLSRIVVQAVRG
jgi:hypothetical protein